MLDISYTCLYCKRKITYSVFQIHDSLAQINAVHAHISGWAVKIKVPQIMLEVFTANMEFEAKIRDRLK